MSMTEQPARRRPRAVKPAESPEFSPDPEIVSHLEGNARAIKRYKLGVKKMAAAARAERPPHVKA
jgi:hypothetical protein